MGYRRKPDLFSSPGTLREALYAVVHRSTKPAKVQAEELNISYSYLCNAANPNLEGEGFDYQLRYLLPHTRMTGNFAVVNFIERALGRVGIPILGRRALPRSERQATVDRELLGVAKELGDAAAEVQRCLKDGSLSPAEAHRCRKEVWELIEQAAVVYQVLEACEES